MTFITDNAKGDPQDIQINIDGKLSGDNNFTWDGDSLKLSDSKNLMLGNESFVSSISGDLIIDNKNITGSTIIKLGTDNSNTNFVVEDSNSSNILTIDGSSLVKFSTNSNVHLQDNVEFRIGNDNDLIIIHDTNNTNITSNTGNLNIVNTSGTDDIIFKMGDSSSASNIQFTDNLDNPVMLIRSDRTEESESRTTGAVRITGGLGVSMDISANSFNTASDEKLKEDIKDLDNPLETLNKVRGYRYLWKKDNGDGKENWGVLAQQLEEIGLGHMVSDGPDHKCVNYTMLIPLLIEAVKELNTKIEKKEQEDRDNK